MLCFYPKPLFYFPAARSNCAVHRHARFPHRHSHPAASPCQSPSFVVLKNLHFLSWVCACIELTRYHDVFEFGAYAQAQPLSPMTCLTLRSWPLVKISGLLIQCFSCYKLIFAHPANSLAYCTHNVNISCMPCKNIYCYMITVFRKFVPLTKGV